MDQVNSTGPVSDGQMLKGEECGESSDQNGGKTDTSGNDQGMAETEVGKHEVKIIITDCDIDCED